MTKKERQAWNIKQQNILDEVQKFIDEAEQKIREDAKNKVLEDYEEDEKR